MANRKHFVCVVAGCDKTHQAHGFCNKHYRRLKKHGDPLAIRPNALPPAARFWNKVEKTRTCWLWQGSIFQGKKYGQFRADGKNWRAHRFAYQLLRGPIPSGLVLDHLCRNPRCVNPKHLEPVTAAENAARNPKDEFCKRGHAREPNTRRCKICSVSQRFKPVSRASSKEYLLRKKQRARRFFHG